MWGWWTLWYVIEHIVPDEARNSMVLVPMFQKPELPNSNESAEGLSEFWVHEYSLAIWNYCRQFRVHDQRLSRTPTFII